LVLFVTLLLQDPAARQEAIATAVGQALANADEDGEKIQVLVQQAGMP
jgi:hypothetical protein